MRWLRNLFSRPEAAEPPAAAPAAPAPAAPAAPLPAPPGWESFRRPSERGPAAIAADLSLQLRAPVADRPRLHRVRVALRAPREDGLPGPDEAEALARVEDLLAAALAPAGALYAGRVTLAGAREHLFYLPDATGISAELDRIRAEVADYDLEHLAEDDPAWEAWRDELLPPPRTWRWLQDRRMVEALARAGDPLAAPRPVDHQASFPTAEAREAFAAEATLLGFEPAARRDDAPPPNAFAVDLRRAGPVDLQSAHLAAWSLCELAGRHGGAYDGWEAELVPAARG